MRTIAKIAVVLLTILLLLSGCGGEEYPPYENSSGPDQVQIVNMGNSVLEVERINTNYSFADPLDMFRVFDTELCIVFYVTTSGVGAPIPLAELAASTDTYLELADYCQGGFK